MIPGLERRILLVEDNADDEEFVLEALRRHNLAALVTVARDGAEALDFLFRRGAFAQRPAGHPRVILLDLKLPKVTGLEVLRVIRSTEHLRQIPVAIFTSSREQRDLAEAYRLGANAFVVKPVVFTEFAEAVGILGRFWVNLNELPQEFAP